MAIRKLLKVDTSIAPMHLDGLSNDKMTKATMFGFTFQDGFFISAK
jgi:hypothetical protein